MRDILLIICFFILFCCGFFSGYKNGEREKQQEIENRTDKVLKSKQINKECYTNQDIEIIVFGNTRVK